MVSAMSTQAVTRDRWDMMTDQVYHVVFLGEAFHGFSLIIATVLKDFHWGWYCPFKDTLLKYNKRC